MQQQINLFQPVFRREAKVFSACTLAQVLAIAAILIIAGIALLHLQLQRHGATRDLLNSQFLSLEKQLTAIETQADAGQLATLDARIKTLETQLMDGSAELAEIQQRVVSRSAGFASVFTALARHPVNGLWITGVQIQQDSLAISGTTLDPERLPRYLTLLTDDADLAQWSLSTVQMERNSKTPGQVNFTLSSSTTHSVSDSAREQP